MSVHILKFGGTSMGNASSIGASSDIIAEKYKNNEIIVVVSAMTGVTNELIYLIQLAMQEEADLVMQKIDDLRQRHLQTLEALVQDQDFFEQFWELHFEQKFTKLRNILHGTSFVGDITDKTRALICSYGEKLASCLIMAILELKQIDCEIIAAESLIFSDSSYLEANVQFAKTNEIAFKLLAPRLNAHKLSIVPGFTAANPGGHTTLLGRGGSDYTGAIIAEVVGADALEIWTDVNGILSADPRKVENTVQWDELGFDIVSEMAYSGAKVIHPKSIIVAINKSIPVYVYNTFNASHKGTKITQHSRSGIRGIVSSNNNILIHIEDPHMLDNVGFIAKVTGLVEELGIPIDVCVTSETSFTFSVKEHDYSEDLKQSLAESTRVSVIKNVTKLALIGYKITQDAALVARIFNECARQNLSLDVISMGYSLNNITIMLSEDQGEHLLKCLHQDLLAPR